MRSSSSSSSSYEEKQSRSCVTGRENPENTRVRFRAHQRTLQDGRSKRQRQMHLSESSQIQRERIRTIT
eukprot:2915624-Amphidinium_carterae.1